VLTFVPAVEGVEFNPPARSFRWVGRTHKEEFELRAARELDGTTARGTVTVFLGSILLADIDVALRVESGRAGAEPPEATHARPYRKIFASYSHKDAAVVEQFERFARSLGDEYLRDWRHLRAGEVWDDRLRRMIEEADVFQLFWSRNAMDSEYVRREYEHALGLNRPHFVRPTYWEEPLPRDPARGLPPEVLQRLHFQQIRLDAGYRQLLDSLPAGYADGAVLKCMIGMPVAEVLRGVEADYFAARAQRRTLRRWLLTAAVLALAAGLALLAVFGFGG
jgi:hypothetical protein